LFLASEHELRVQGYL